MACTLPRKTRCALPAHVSRGGARIPTPRPSRPRCLQPVGHAPDSLGPHRASKIWSAGPTGRETAGARPQPTPTKSTWPAAASTGHCDRSGFDASAVSPQGRHWPDAGHAATAARFGVTSDQGGTVAKTDRSPRKHPAPAALPARPDPDVPWPTGIGRGRLDNAGEGAGGAKGRQPHPRLGQALPKPGCARSCSCTVVW